MPEVRLLMSSHRRACQCQNSEVMGSIQSWISTVTCQILGLIWLLDKHFLRRSIQRPVAYPDVCVEMFGGGNVIDCLSTDLLLVTRHFTYNIDSSCLSLTQIWSSTSEVFMQIVKVTAEELQKELSERTQPLVIDFYATWCGPCLLLAKELEKVRMVTVTLPILVLTSVSSARPNEGRPSFKEHSQFQNHYDYSWWEISDRAKPDFFEKNNPCSRILNHNTDSPHAFVRPSELKDHTELTNPFLGHCMRDRQLIVQSWACQTELKHMMSCIVIVWNSGIQWSFSKLIGELSYVWFERHAHLGPKVFSFCFDSSLWLLPFSVTVVDSLTIHFSL